MKTGFTKIIFYDEKNPNTRLLQYVEQYPSEYIADDMSKIDNAARAECDKLYKYMIVIDNTARKNMNGQYIPEIIGYIKQYCIQLSLDDATSMVQIEKNYLMMSQSNLQTNSIDMLIMDMDMHLNQYYDWI